MSRRVKKKKRRERSSGGLFLQGLVIVLLLSALAGLLFLNHNRALEEEAALARAREAAAATPEPASAPTPAPTPKPTPAPAPTTTPVPEFQPHAVEGTEPENLIKSTGIQVDGTAVEVGSYEAEEPIDFMPGEEYTRVEGIVTFRGDNFRSGAAYGFANMTEFQFADAWSVETGTTSYNGDTWTGSGWVGQPLIVKWPGSTKAIMNMYDWARDDDELVEVIYATMDGNVYFLDLKTGKATRDKLSLGYTFKGAGALDPRGYPIMYLGSGYNSNKGKSHAFIISLVDCSVMYEFGSSDGFALRSTSFFDGSALVDAETDQLIYPGENGLLYIIKLNTDYDEKAGTLSIDPDRVVKWRYNGKRTTGGAYWLGMEDSAVIWRGHIIMADNGGNLMCLDLNTLELAWVQDTLDDTNCSPVLSLEDGNPYVYISTSFHLGWRSSSTATIPIWKIDAETGEIVWQTEYTCYTQSGVSGGVQSTAGLGKYDLEGYLYVTVAKTDRNDGGKLVCLDTATGDVVWEHDAYYTWSSPVPVYNEDGSGYVAYCTFGQTLYLLDGKTGEVLDTFDLGSGVEASPAVYKDWLVVGTRGCRIWGLRLS